MRVRAIESPRVAFAALFAAAALAAGCDDGSAELATTESALVPGYYVTLQTAYGGCLSVPNGRTEDGVQLIDAPCTGASNQIFRPLSADGSPNNTTPQIGQWRRYVIGSSEKCIDLEGASSAAGARVIQWTCNGGQNQLWAYMSAYTWVSGTRMSYPTIGSPVSGNFIHPGPVQGDGITMRPADGVYTYPTPMTPNGDAAPIPAGRHVAIVAALDASACVDIPGSSMDVGVAPIAWTCHDGLNQTFRLVADDDRVLDPDASPPPGRLVNANSNRCLRVTSAGAVVQDQCALSDSTRWSLTGQGVKSVSTGRCLAFSGGGISLGDCAASASRVVLRPREPSLDAWSGKVVEGTPLTLTGARFGAAAGKVTVGGVDCPVTAWSASAFTCTAPRASTLGVDVVVTSAQGLRSARLSATAGVVLQSVSPDPAPLWGTTAMVTLRGLGFGGNPKVSLFDKTATSCQISSASGTSIACVADIADGPGRYGFRVINGPLGSNTVYVTVARPPVVTSLLPASVLDAGSTLALTLSGSDLGGSPRVTVGDAACALATVDATRITCSVATPAPGTYAVVVANNGLTSAPVSLTVRESPRLEAIAPSDTRTRGGGMLALTGSRFGPLGRVRVGQADCPVLIWTTTFIRCTLPPGEGTRDVVVISAAGDASGALPLTYSAPTLASLAPAYLSTAGGDLTLSGQDFGQSPEVLVGGKRCVVASASDSALTCRVPALPAGQHAVTLTHPSGTSNALTLTVERPPRIVVLAPSMVYASPDPIALTVEGDDFGAAPVVTLGGAACTTTTTTTSSGAPRLAASCPSADVGVYDVVVVAGRWSSAPRSFEVRARPVLDPLAGSFGTAGGLELALSGRGLGAAGSVHVGDAVCPLLSWSPTLVRCTLPPGDGAQAVVLATAAGDVADAVTLTRARPAVVQLSSSSVPSSGARLTLTGANFGLVPSVAVGDATCAIASHSHSEIVCDVPALPVGSYALVVTTPSGSSTAQSLAVVDP
ncbi:MAG: IPT/TIG domain-containing protein [Myxococcota bacterium]